MKSLIMLFGIAICTMVCIAAPQRSILGVNGTEYAGSGEQWVNPYITDGLIAMWDGEWNISGGIHTLSIENGWKDILGDCNLTIPNNGYWSFGQKSVNLRKRYETQGGVVLSIPSAYFNLLEYSIEICLSRGNDTYDSEFGIRSANNSFLLEAYSNTSIRMRTWDTEGQLKINYGKNVTDTTLPHTLTLVYNGTRAMGYVNGVYAVQSSHNMQSLNAYIIRIGNFYLYGYGSIYDIRIYNRALTSNEVLQNYQVDQERFNLP